MEVDNVGKMDKTGAKCVLKGEASVNGVPAKFSMSISCDGRDVFEGMGIDEQNSTIELILQDSAQTKLVE
jgi:hypothetical protein